LQRQATAVVSVHGCEADPQPVGLPMGHETALHCTTPVSGFPLRSWRAIHPDHRYTPWYQLWRQPLACLIRMPWPLFFLAMGLIYLAELLLFSSILWLDRQHLMGNPPMGLPRSFVFAASAFFANSFNEITPDSPFSYGVGMVDMISGLITLSTLTAVVFARLSRYESPLNFSRHICLSRLEAGGHLMCRFITREPSQWLNVSYSLSLVFDDEIEPGLWQRRIVPLELINPGTPQLSQTATLIHSLAVDSPILWLGLEELQCRNAVIIPLVEGIDESTGSTLLQTHLYRMDDVQRQRRFRELVSTDPNGKRQVHLERLNVLMPC
jgi:inward rectifier potassium channel